MKIESPLEVLSRAASIVQNEEKAPVSPKDTKVSQGKNHTEAIKKFHLQFRVCIKIIISYSVKTLSFQTIEKEQLLYH